MRPPVRKSLDNPVITCYMAQMGMPIKNDRIARYLELIDDDHAQATLEEMFSRMTSSSTSATSPMEGGRSESLREICDAWYVPYHRIMLWLMDDPKRYAVYERALEIEAHGLAQETLRIADDEPERTERGTIDTGSITRAKLRIDTRFRLAGYHARSVYGAGAEGSGGVTVVVDRSCGGAVTVATQGTQIQVGQQQIQQGEADGRVINEAAIEATDL